MTCSKNLPSRERAARIALGALSVAIGLWFRDATGWIGAGAGATLALTGAVGFCPLRAILGRRSQRS